MCGPIPVMQKGQCIEVLEATSQEWISGVRGGGSNITYRLRVSITTGCPVVFDSIWVAGKGLPVKAVGSAQPHDPKTTRDAVVTLIASEFRGSTTSTGEQQPIPPPGLAKVPLAYKGAALVRYRVDGVEQYLTVPGITVLPRVYGQ